MTPTEELSLTVGAGQVLVCLCAGFDVPVCRFAQSALSDT